MECPIPEWSIMRMWLSRASIRVHVAPKSSTSASAGRTAQTISPAREADGTSSDLLADLVAKLKRRMASSASAQAAAAIQKIVSASG